MKKNIIVICLLLASCGAQPAFAAPAPNDWCIIPPCTKQYCAVKPCYKPPRAVSIKINIFTKGKR